MSIHGILDAMRSDLPPAHRLVWQCLENRSNSARLWSISIDNMAVELNLSRDTVTRAVKNLEKKHILRVERRKRRPSLYRLLRTYPTNCSGTPGLAPQNADSNRKLTSQNADSNRELTSQNADQNCELTPQNRDVVDSNSKNPPEGVHQRHARGDGKPTIRLLPDDWHPRRESLKLAATLGMDAARVAAEAARMRDWAAFKAAKGTDWDQCFDGWLREEARRDQSNRPWKPNQQRSRHDIIRKELGGQSFLTSNFERETPSLLREEGV
jgi:hypothetical protein